MHALYKIWYPCPYRQIVDTSVEQVPLAQREGWEDMGYAVLLHDEFLTREWERIRRHARLSLMDLQRELQQRQAA